MKFNSTDAVITKALQEELTVGDAVERILDEQLTPGIRNVLASVSKPKYVCPWCGFPIPKYPGRYPVKCPECRSFLDYSDPGEENLVGRECETELE